MLLLPCVYLGNIRYYTKLLQGRYPVTIDVGEHYRKQSYRNRCDILGANGPLSLTVPVFKKSGEKLRVRDVRIDYAKEWQHQHWHSIVSAYRNSPYFDYYGEAFEPFYLRRYEFLSDFNQEIQSTVLDILGVHPKIKLSETYVAPEPGIRDCRDAFSPKPRLEAPDETFVPASYYQVFSDRYGFVPDLSILDLIFCEGPEAMKVILASTRFPEDTVSGR